MSEEEPPEELAEKKPSRLKVSRFWIGVIAIGVVVALIFSVVMLNPSISPYPTVRDMDADGVADAFDVFPNNPDESADSDADGVGDNGDAFPDDPSETRDFDSDGVGDNADFLDTGNGGLRVRIELFEPISGACAAICDPSIKLEVDWDGDGAIDLVRRADLTGASGNNPLINPISWTFDIPDSTQTVNLTVFIRDLFVRGPKREVDINADPRFTSHFVTITVPFPSIQFVTEGDQGDIGRLTYTVEAIEL